MNKQEENTAFLSISETPKKILFFLGVVLCMTPYISPAFALFFGIIIAQFIGHPYSQVNSKITSYLLKISVIGLGFGLNVATALETGKDGFIFTLISIVSILILGYLLGKLFKVERKTSYLISAGTAICGGSAIAAISPIIKAKENQITIALGTVFILNSVALVIFPYIGTSLNLSQTQFGMWCAIAIHDTSSVVGAASIYGDEALTIATTVKLARALWIIPLGFLSAFIFKTKGRKVKIPYFIFLFILAIIISTYIPFIQEYKENIVHIAKKGLTLTLFLIGCGLNRSLLKNAGLKPILQGVILWGFVSIAALTAILYLYS
ncbi:MAG: putative sulfate exporter family transporter [Flavobacteriales bacterium]